MNIRKGVYLLLFGVIFFISGSLMAQEKEMNSTDKESLLKMSEQLLFAVKTDKPTDVLEKSLSDLKADDIYILSDDRSKLVFWINVYNAWFQMLAKREQLKRPSIFTRKAIPIAGYRFSLDDIEHGILRHYRCKYSMGYLPQLFPGKRIKKLAVDNIDYRIHFALNCGARSCPPIAFYTYDNIEKQLSLAEKSFLKSETRINDSVKTINTSRILSWFRADFGGKKGIRKILGDVFNKDLKGYRIKFDKYDWSSRLDYYADE